MKINGLAAIRPVHSIVFALVISFAIALGSSTALAAERDATYTTVDFFSEVESLPKDGGLVTLGLYLKPHPTWHAYWKNPGDAGLAAKMKWDLPDGFEPSVFEFPTPHLIPFGPMNTYGYEEPVLLLVDVRIPSGLPGEDLIRLAAKANWVVCDDRTCVPDSMDVELFLPVGDGSSDAAVADRFFKARSELPVPVEWSAHFVVQGEKVHINVEHAPASQTMQDVYLFPAAKNLVKYDEQITAFTPDGFTVSMNAHKDVGDKSALPFVLTYEEEGQQRAVQLTASLDESPSAQVLGSPTTSPVALQMNVLTALLFAFLGGIILNTMPCVFPILSMKALSLVKVSLHDKKLARESGLTYTAGIVVAFAVVGGALLAFRYGGQMAGWGFQMQYPLVNLGLALLMVVIALNLFGVFELGTGMMSAGSELVRGGERRKSFFTGLLAVVVATPCTAPFMAGALGFAMMQPAAISLFVFLALGFGLAFPYLLLSYVPDLGRFLPKPGAWMDTLKRVLAFPMLATALWLFWVVGKQAGTNSFALALLAALVLAFALWAFGHSALSPKKLMWRIVAGIGVFVAIYSTYLVEIYREHGSIGAQTEGTHQLGGLTLEPFSPELVQGYLASGQPTFVYFTADWCISCKANERVALATDAVADAFHKRGIRVVEGDWTSQNPVITEWLQRYGRVGVPLYLYFGPGSTLETPVILPQILTPDIVIRSTAG